MFDFIISFPDYLIYLIEQEFGYQITIEVLPLVICFGLFIAFFIIVYTIKFLVRVLW